MGQLLGITKWDQCYYKAGQVLQSEAIITMWALTCYFGFCVFGFEAMPHTSCYLTSIMDKTHHAPVIALFSVQLQQLFWLRRR